MNRLLEKLQRSGKAGIEDLKSLYRRLALSLHPDRSREGPEAFVRLQREYEEALRELSRDRQPGGASVEPTPFYLALEAYLENIDTANIVLSLASNPAKRKLDELLDAVSGRKDLSGLFGDVRDVFHLNFNGVLRYPSIRTAFIGVTLSMWQLVLFRKHGDRLNSDIGETYLREVEYGLKKQTGAVNGTGKREISVIVRLIDFVRDELKHGRGRGAP